MPCVPIGLQRSALVAVRRSHYLLGVADIEVVAERSCRRVITSELVAGLTFDEACAAPAADRARWGETLWRFVFGSLLGHGLFNADPHPGNYVFAPDGGVYFLDFGCTRHLEARQVGLSVRSASTRSSRGST